MATSGTDDRLLCVALAAVDPGPRRGKEPTRITEKIGNPSIRQAIPDKSTFAAAADQPAVEQAAQMVRDVGLPQSRMTDNFLHVAFA